MSNDINKVILCGTLGADGELRYGQSGTTVLNLRVATSETWIGRDNQEQKNTTWHNVVLFGEQAERVGKEARKGARVLVEGKIQTRSWEKDGVKQYMTQINAWSVTILNAPRQESAQAPRQGGYGRSHRPAQDSGNHGRAAATPPTGPNDEYAGYGGNSDSDLPF